MASVIRIKRGNQANLPRLQVGELAFTLDTKRLYIGTLTGNWLLACGCDASDSDEFEYAGLGGIVLGGGAELALAFKAAGGLLLGDAARLRLPLRGVGGVVLGDVARMRFPYRPTGGCFIGDTARYRLPFEALGGCLIGGTAEYHNYISGQGGLLLGGTMRTNNPPIEGEGGLLVGGTAAIGYNVEPEGGLLIGGEAELIQQDGPLMPAAWTLTIADTTDDTCEDCEIFNDDWELTQSSPTIWGGGGNWSCSVEEDGFLAVFLVRFGGGLTLHFWDFSPAFPFASWTGPIGETWNGTDPIVLTGGANGGENRCEFPETVTITPA